MGGPATRERFGKLWRAAALGCLLLSGACAAALYDRDGDGIDDRVDIDPFKAEDRDGVEDDDGLPELPSPAAAAGIPEGPAATPEQAAAETDRLSGGLEEPAEVPTPVADADTLDLDDAYFKAGELDLSSGRIGDLERLARLMVENNRSRLVIRTCVDTGGTVEISQSLAEFRARSIHEYLSSAFGIRDSRIAVEQVTDPAARKSMGRPALGLIDCRVQIILFLHPD